MKERNNLKFAELNGVRYLNAGNGSGTFASGWKPIEKRTAVSSDPCFN